MTNDQPFQNNCLHQLLLFLIICLFASSNIRAAAEINSDSKVIDSLKTVISVCTTDTCRFNILMNYFWSKASNDISSVKAVGEWAYNEIRNSKNQKALSDGLDILGCILENEKKYDSAYIVFQKAFAISKKTGYNARISWSYYHLGLINENQGHIDSTFYYYKTLADFNIKAGFSEPACDVLNVIGSLYERIKQNDSAFFYYNKALTLSRQIKNINQEINTLFNFVWFYNENNNTKKVLEHLEMIIELAEKSNNEKSILNVYYYIGNLFLEQKKNPDMALAYYLRILDKSHLKFEYLEAGILNDIGKLYIAKGNDSLALDYTTRSLDISRKINYKHQISESYKNMGAVYMHQSELQKAIDSYTYCYNLGCDKCPKIKFHSALIDIADAFLKLNRKDSALYYYSESLKLANEFDYKPDQAKSKLKLGNFYIGSKNQLSEKFYKDAFHCAQLSNDIHILKDVADTLNSFYRNQKNFQAAYEYQSISRSMEDSIAKIEQQESMADWEMKFEFDKLNKDNEAKTQLSAAEIKRQKTFRNSAILVALLLLILGWVIWRNYINKKKDVQLLEFQNKQIEEQNHEIQAQIEEITTQKEEIERISSKLHEADAAKLRFFSNLSHEFRTPLTLIMNPAKNLLTNAPFNGDYKKQIEYIYSNALKLYDLTNQIMDLQKLDAGKLELNITHEDIISFCLGVTASFESLCEPKKVSIHIESNVSNVIAEFDKDKIGKILTNLLSNAIKFSYENTVIEVFISNFDHSLIIQITDKGLGIPSGEVNDVFRRYKQASNNKNVGGTGIGLAYVYELVTFMNGKVSLDSKENIGTKVKVEIPVRSMEIEDNTPLSIEIAYHKKVQATKSFDTNEFTEENSDKEVILIVEDNDQLRNYIARLFQPEFYVILAPDGQTGIEMALKHTPDIIISDVMMPKTNGFELCTAIKNDVHTSHIPVLLLTAKDTEQSSLEGYHSGADDYILKPFDNEILKLKVRNILKTKEALGRQFNSDLNLLPNAGAYSDVDKNFMKKCIHCIESNISNSDFSVEMLAAELGFSRSNLYRKIISLTNFNPAELIRNLRMQHAAKLLKTSDLRVNEVAFEVGYDSPDKFSQAFRKHHGVLPSQIQ